MSTDEGEDDIDAVRGKRLGNEVSAVAPRRLRPRAALCLCVRGDLCDAREGGDFAGDCGEEDGGEEGGRREGQGC